MMASSRKQTKAGQLAIATGRLRKFSRSFQLLRDVALLTIQLSLAWPSLSPFNSCVHKQCFLLLVCLDPSAGPSTVALADLAAKDPVDADRVGGDDGQDHHAAVEQELQHHTAVICPPG